MSGFRFPVFFSALGRSLAAAATQAAAKALLGIVDFDPAEPGPIGATTPSTGRFTSLSALTPGSVALSLNSYDSTRSTLSGMYADRFWSATTRYPVGGTAANPQNAFDGSQNTLVNCGPGDTRSIEINVLAAGYRHSNGRHVITWHFSLKPASYSVEVKMVGGDWVVINSGTTPPTVLALDAPNLFGVVEFWRIVWTAPPGANAQLMGWQNHPFRLESGEKQLWTESASPSEQSIHSPGLALRAQSGATYISLRAPNGTQWRYTPDNAGNLIATQV